MLNKQIKWSCGVSFVLGAVFMLLASSISLFVVSRHYRHPARPSANSLIASVGARHIPPPPPWGKLEAFEVPLANPGGKFPDAELRLQPPKWFFENLSEDRLVRFFNSCDLLPIQQKVLINRRYWRVLTNGIEVTPPSRLIWFLSPTARHQIYSVLGNNAANYSQANPFRFPPQAFELRFKDSGLPLEDISLLKRLSYPQAGMLCFSDLQTAQTLLQPGEFEDLLETLYAIPACALRLHVTPETDLDALIHYWGKGGRENQIAPLLKALARIPGGGTINISCLLPPFARLRLYTYPDSWNDPTVQRQDCFFSALNFFNQTPDTNFLDTNFVERVFEHDFEPCSADPVFGDIVLLLHPSGKALHVCVFLADDFVFTKNGMDSAMPWVIMRLPDILALYFAPDTSGRLVFLRRKVHT